MMADRDDGTSAAMRRRQRRLRSWWRHEQRSVAAALAAATHHSAPRSGWPEQYYAPPLPEVAGPQAAVTVGYVAAVAPSLAVVRVLDLVHDGATVQFLLQQSLLARAQEEEEARELEEVKRMEEAVVTKMQRLEAEVMRYAGRDRSQLSDLEYAAVTLVARSDALRRRRERRKKRKKQRKKKLPRAPRPRCRRPCDHQRQVLAVHRAPVPVHRQSGGHSCFRSMDLADPVSSGKYSGTFVFTARVSVPIVMSFTVPLDGCTIVATATVVTPCSSSADCPVSAAQCVVGVLASRCRVVVEVSLLVVLTILFGTV